MGILNNYNKRERTIKRFNKDIAALCRFAWLKARNRKLDYIYVYPEYPSESSIVFGFAKSLNLFITNKLLPGKLPRICVYWHNTTHRPADIKSMHQAISNANLPLNAPVFHEDNILNLRNTDISKKHVDNIFTNVFGYSSFVDPTNTKGLAVCKADQNSVKDAHIIECPISKDEVKDDRVYQLVIDSKADNSSVAEIRAPIVNGQIPFVFLKYHNLEERFENKSELVEFKQTYEVLSEEEVNKIIEFCRRMPVDLAELDVMRHSDDRLFIIDVNNTPISPPRTGLSSSLKKRARKELAQTFTPLLR